MVTPAALARSATGLPTAVADATLPPFDPEGLLLGRRGGERAARGVVDDLGADVARRAKDAQARAFGRARYALADAGVAADAAARACALLLIP